MATKVKPSRLQVSWTPQAWDVPVYVNEDCFQWCAGWGWGWWCAMWWCITWTLCDQTDLQWALDCKLNASALSNAAYWSGWDGDSTHAATKDAIYDKIRTVDTALAGKANDISVVKLTCNQLIDWTKTFCISPVVPSKCAAAVNCDTAIATEAQVYNVAQAIPTDNCQLANWCGYTTCTGTVSTCADVISALGYTPYSAGNPCNYINNFAGVVSALGYTPYNNTNPCGFTTCTGTVVACDLAPYVQGCCVACINWCCLTQWGDICIQSGWIQLAPNTVYCPVYHWYWPQSCYDCLAQYYTCCANDTAYFTTDE